MADDRFLMFVSGAPFAISGCRAAYFDKTRCPELQGLYDPDPYERKAAPDDTAPPEGEKPHSEMTPENAHTWLGLQKGATEKQINAAWRATLKQVHPDGGDFVAGGFESAHRDYLTRQVNEARDVLLRELGA
jgi:hypothetical protein